MKQPKSRNAELAPNAMGGGKSHAETAYPPAGGCPRSGCPSRGESAEFKMTELGPIPEDWEVKRLGEIFTFKNGYNASANCYGSGIPVASVLDALSTRSITRQSIATKVNAPSKDQDSFSLKSGDLIFTRSSETLEDVGRSNVYLDADNAMFGGFVIRGRPSVVIDSLFVNYMLNTSSCRIRVMSHGAGAQHFNIGQSGLEKVLIPLPPLAEQRRIAGALSDVDELISALGKLIEKKRNIKTGTMQQLLTGKTRLPGFKGKWEEKRLGDVATMFAGGTPPSNVDRYYGGDIPWVSISDISVADKFVNETVEQLTEEGLNNSSAKWYPGNTLLFAMYASIGKCCIARRRMTSSQAILGIYNLIDLDIEFLYYLLTLRNDEFLAIGQTGTQSNLSKAIVGNVVVNVPTLAEQEAIAAVLSDMDAEIAALEADRAKYERIKSGMMQELLTGKTRLKGE